MPLRARQVPRRRGCSGCGGARVPRLARNSIGSSTVLPFAFSLSESPFPLPTPAPNLPPAPATTTRHPMLARCLLSLRISPSTLNPKASNPSSAPVCSSLPASSQFASRPPRPPYSTIPSPTAPAYTYAARHPAHRRSRRHSHNTAYYVDQLTGCSRKHGKSIGFNEAGER